MLNFLFHLDFSATPASSINGSILVPFIIICLGLIIRVGLQRSWGATNIVFISSFAIYLFALVEILFFSIPIIPHEIVDARQFSHPRMNLVPFVDILSQPKSIAFRNLFGNIAIFIPLGFFIPALTETKNNYTRAMMIIISSALAVEVIQYIGSFVLFKIDWKVVDIDDVIMNIFGGMLGLATYLITSKLLMTRKKQKSTCME